MIDKEEQRRRARQIEKDAAAQGLTAPKLPMPKLKGPKGPVDMEGKAFFQGAKVVRGFQDATLKICKVTKMVDGKLFLDDSNKPIRVPERLLILK